MRPTATQPKPWKAAAPKTGQRRGEKIVVHLGNIGWNKDPQQWKSMAEKTRKYAQRFPGVRFIGIDLVKPQPIHEFQRSLPNWVQIQGDFVEGMQTLPAHSVSAISSELGVGHYNRRGESDRSPLAHTLETIRVAHTKLKPNGKLFLVVSYDALPAVRHAIETAGFNPSKISATPLKPSSIKRTAWTRKYSRSRRLFQVEAQK